MSSHDYTFQADESAFRLLGNGHALQVSGLSPLGIRARGTRAALAMLEGVLIDLNEDDLGAIRRHHESGWLGLQADGPLSWIALVAGVFEVLLGFIPVSLSERLAQPQSPPVPAPLSEAAEEEFRKWCLNTLNSLSPRAWTDEQQALLQAVRRSVEDAVNSTAALHISARSPGRVETARWLQAIAALALDGAPWHPQGISEYIEFIELGGSRRVTMDHVVPAEPNELDNRLQDVRAELSGMRGGGETKDFRARLDQLNAARAGKGADLSEVRGLISSNSATAAWCGARLAASEALAPQSLIRLVLNPNATTDNGPPSGVTRLVVGPTGLNRESDLMVANGPADYQGVGLLQLSELVRLDGHSGPVLTDVTAWLLEGPSIRHRADEGAVRRRLGAVLSAPGSTSPSVRAARALLEDLFGHSPFRATLDTAMARTGTLPSAWLQTLVDCVSSIEKETLARIGGLEPTDGLSQNQPMPATGDELRERDSVLRQVVGDIASMAEDATHDIEATAEDAALTVGRRERLAEMLKDVRLPTVDEWKAHEGIRQGKRFGRGHAQEQAAIELYDAVLAQQAEEWLTAGINRMSADQFANVQSMVESLTLEEFHLQVAESLGAMPPAPTGAPRGLGRPGVRVAELIDWLNERRARLVGAVETWGAQEHERVVEAARARARELLNDWQIRETTPLNLELETVRAELDETWRFEELSALSETRTVLERVMDEARDWQSQLGVCP